MEPIPYKGFFLSSASKKTIDDKWTTEVTVTSLSDGTFETQYSASNLYSTKQEADEHSINLGKHYIDKELL